VGNLTEELKEKGVEFTDVKLSDLAGRLHHITFPLSRLEVALSQGIGFDGSSLGGFREVADSDLIAKPDISTMMIDPFHKRPTVSFYSDIYQPDGKTPFPACPRNILRKVLELVRSKGLADEVQILPEFELYIFDNAEFVLGTTSSGYTLSTIEEESTLGLKNAYHVTPPTDTTANLRSDVVSLIQDAGIKVKYHHHEVGRFSQVEIETAPLKAEESGDAIQTVKYIIKNHVANEGLFATFMPKPLADQAGSGLHLHMQFWKDERNVFASQTDENELSETARLFLGGIIKHARALCAFTNPSTNSYLRLRGGMEAPSKVFHSRANRKAALRIPGYVRGAKDLRFEYRVPDATCNPYLALAGILLAGLDVVEQGFDSGPLVVDQPDDADDRFPDLPLNFTEALQALKIDSSFLTRQDMFPAWLIEQWIRAKEKEIEEISSYPAPAEFVKYFLL